MKSSTLIAIIGSIISLIAAIFWYFDKISEPTYAIICAAITLFATLFVLQKEQKNKEEESNNSGNNNVFNKDSTIGTQINNPTGDIKINSPEKWVT